MSAKVHASKLLCYIVRDGQLLVFHHADYDLEHVGVQVPAGSIRHGESSEDAALREAREETGLSQFSIARKLGETVYDITPYRYEIQHRDVFHLQVHEPTVRRWPSQEPHDGPRWPVPLGYSLSLAWRMDTQCHAPGIRTSIFPCSGSG